MYLRKLPMQLCAYPVTDHIVVAVFASDETMTKPDFNETDQYGIPKWRHMKPYGRPWNEKGNHSDAVPIMKSLDKEKHFEYYYGKEGQKYPYVVRCGVLTLILLTN